MIRSVVTRSLWGLALAAFAPPARAAEVPRVASPLPALTLPAPTGREAIGTITVDLTIPEREEVFTERAGDTRKVVLQLWYPAARTRHCARAPYMDPVTARTAVDSAGLPSGFQDRIATHACTGAPPARHPRRWPVILFSHGLGATRFGYATLFEDLASRGYLVVAIHHTYGSLMTVFADGTAAPWDDSRWRQDDEEKMMANLPRNLEEWVADAESVLAFLGRVDRGDAGSGGETAAFRGRLDLGRLGYAGHSFGGSSALLAASRDRRIRAAVDLDGRVVDTLKKPVRLAVPTLVLLSQESPRRGDFAPGPRDTVAKIAGANHASFSDSPLLRQAFGLPDTLAQKLAHPIAPLAGIALTRDALASFFDCTLRGKERRCGDLRAGLAKVASTTP